MYSATKPASLHDKMKEWLLDKIDEEDHLYNDYIKGMEQSNLIINY
jgi:hypothetical protein